MFKVKTLFYLLAVCFGLLAFFQYVSAAIWYDCAYVNGSTKTFLTSIPNGYTFLSGDVEFIISDIDEVKGIVWPAFKLEPEKIYCMSVSYKDKCSTSSDCPVGWKCGGVEGDDVCSLESGSCSVGETFLEGSDMCVVVPANPDQSDACACPHEAIQCMSSPLCSKSLNSLFSGSCKSGFCDAGGKPGDTNVCSDDLYCWQTAGIAKCCESNKCEGAIENCLNNYPGVCPTGFKYIDANFGCVLDCPEAGNGCETDEDCKKGGQNKFCVELTKDSFMTDKDEGMKACLALGIKKSCKFESATTPTEEYKGISFTFPDASGLNQLKSTDVKTIIGNVIKTAMTIMGSVALAMFVYGGILWMSSAGNAERSKKGMQVIVWASLGVFMILASYVIVNFIFSTLS